MPLGRIEFNLDEESRLFQACSKYLDAFLVLQDFNNQLREIIKYRSDQYPDEFIRGIEHAREILFYCMDDRDVNTDLIP